MFKQVEKKNPYLLIEQIDFVDVILRYDMSALLLGKHVSISDQCPILKILHFGPWQT